MILNRGFKLLRWKTYLSLHGFDYNICCLFMQEDIKLYSSLEACLIDILIVIYTPVWRMHDAAADTMLDRQ